MRDPSGYIEFVEDTVLRHVFEEQLDSIDFLHSNLAGELVNSSQLVPFKLQEMGSIKIYSPKISFQSLPTDWCAAQLRAAAILTLNISKSIYKIDYELKDASSWNVLFLGCEPIFCDHLSFQRIKVGKWWAFGQFIRHFIFPLAISKYRRLQVCKIFQMFKDGVSVDIAKRMLGTRIYITRYWPLLIEFRVRQKSIIPTYQKSSRIHQGLYEFLEFMISGFKCHGEVGFDWIGYTQNRSHYQEDAISCKRELVTTWLKDIKPKRVIDLGCNAGEFSQIALLCNAEVVAVDKSESCITHIFSQNRGNKKLYPILADLGNLCGGGGWCGKEYSGLIQRLESWGDVLLMLAIVHHLAISESIPYKAIADMAARICREYLIIEFITNNDEMVKSLCSVRNRSLDDFSIQKQIAAFTEHFEIIKQTDMPGDTRILALLKKK